jgi:transposase-like protein
MKKSRYSEQQIIAVLKEHQAGVPVAELCRKHGISDATFYNWRSRYGGMEVSDARRLKSLEEGEPEAQEAAGGVDAGRRHAPRGARKKLLRPGSRRAFVNWAVEEKSYSQRRACGLIGLDPKIYRYASRRSNDAELRAKLNLCSASGTGVTRLRCTVALSEKTTGMPTGVRQRTHSCLWPAAGSVDGRLS